MKNSTSANTANARTPVPPVYTVLVVKADFANEGLGPAMPDDLSIFRRDTLGELSGRLGVEVLGATNQHGGTANPQLPSGHLDAIRLALSDAREFFAPHPPRLTDDLRAARWCFDQLETIRDRVDHAMTQTRAAFGSHRKADRDDTPLSAAWEAASAIVTPAIDYADMLGDLVLGGPDDGDGEDAEATPARSTT